MIDANTDALNLHELEISAQAAKYEMLVQAFENQADSEGWDEKEKERQFEIFENDPDEFFGGRFE